MLPFASSVEATCHINLFMVALAMGASKNHIYKHRVVSVEIKET